MEPQRKEDFATNPKYKLTKEEIAEWQAAGKIGMSSTAVERAQDRFARGDDVSWATAGRINYLNAAERYELARYILNMRVAKKGLTYQQVLEKAQAVKQERDCGYDYSKVGKPSSGRQWVRRFVKDHPELEVKKAKILELARQRAWNMENVEPFLKLVWDTIDQYEIPLDLLFDLDETSCLVKKAVRKALIVAKGVIPNQTPPNQVFSATLLLTVDANGGYVKPCLILKDKHNLDEALPELQNMINIQQTPSGWINTEVLEDYLLNVFIPHVDRIRKDTDRVGKKALLLLDGHSSRLNLNLWAELRRNDIVVICLPAHTSNRFAALDLTVNGQLKSLFGQLPKFPSKTVLRAEFLRWIRCLYDLVYKALSPEVISKGFELAYIKSPYVSDKDLRARCRKDVLDNVDVLPRVCPLELQPVRKNDTFSIGGKELTSAATLNEWQAYLAKRGKVAKEVRRVGVEERDVKQFVEEESVAYEGDGKEIEELQKRGALRFLDALEDKDDDDTLE